MSFDREGSEMTKRQAAAREAEKLVRRILVDGFKQKLDAQTLRAVAEKVSLSIPDSASKETKSTKAA